MVHLHIGTYTYSDVLMDQKNLAVRVSEFFWTRYSVHFFIQFSFPGSKTTQSNIAKTKIRIISNSVLRV